jgi:hypothetical protein
VKKAGIAQSIQRWAAGWTAGVRFPTRIRDFLYFTASRAALEPTQPPTQWMPGALTPRLKRQGYKTDNSSPSSAEVKNGAIPPLPHTYCGVLPKKPAYQRFIARQQLRKYATVLESLLGSGPRATMEVQLEAVFCMWSAPRLYHSIDRVPNSTVSSR